MSVNGSPRALSRAMIAAAALVAAAPAGATVVTTIDAFVITRSGVPPSPLGIYRGELVFYRDDFGDGAVPPTGGVFFSGDPGTYVILGSYPATAESNGSLGLDSSLGGPFVNANGGSRTLQRSTLPTDVDPATDAGLKRDFHTFSVYGLFDLMIPPLPRDGYGITVNDGGPTGATESIDLFVRREESGALVIRFQEQDFLNGVITTLDRDPLVIPTGADQIELQLRRNDLATNLLTASYRFWDDGLPLSPFTPMSTTADFFTHQEWARGVFFAVEGTAPIPEPSTFALLLAGGAGLITAVSLRRRAGA